VWYIDSHMAAIDRYFPVEKGGEKMSKFPAWLLLILNFLMSDLFDQLVDWAKEIIVAPSVQIIPDTDVKRAQAVSLLRAKAAVEGVKVSKWQAGQVVEAAFAAAYPWKTKALEA
jgi:hypothetical protein